MEEKPTPPRVYPYLISDRENLEYAKLLLYRQLLAVPEDELTQNEWSLMQELLREPGVLEWIERSV